MSIVLPDSGTMLLLGRGKWRGFPALPQAPGRWRLDLPVSVTPSNLAITMGRQSMVQTLSPDVHKSALANIAPTPGRTYGLFDRMRRLVLPDQADGASVEHPAPDTRRTARRQSTSAVVLSRLTILLPRLILGACAVLLLLAIGLFAFRSLYGDRIYPAVIVGDMPVGGLTQDAAREKLDARAAYLDQHAVTFTYNGKSWTPTLSEIGAEIQVDQALTQAQQLGRTGDAVERLAVTGDLLQADQSIPLTTTLDTGKLNAWFDKVDREMNTFAVNAGLVVSGGEVSITPDATGTVVDRAAATRIITGALTDLQPVSTDLPTQVDQPAITAADLEPSKAQLANSLSSHIRVDFEGQSWRIEPNTLSQFLTVTQSIENGKLNVDISMNQDELSKYLRENFTQEINRKPIDAEVGWNADRGLIATSESADGATLKPSEFAQAVTDSFLGDHHRVSIPVIVTKPKIDDSDLSNLKIDGLLGRGDSNFDGGSDARNTNIYVGVDLLNGELVGPGEEFSFNKAIGAITADKGYVEAAVVVAERVGRDVGGGICQVSTTTFRAALMAGMEIGEWNPHTYRIKGYELDGWGPGFDASILQPEGVDPQYWGDFTFTNNTDGYILVQSWTSYPYVIVEIYGHKDDRTVEITDQYVSDPIPNPVDTEVVDDKLDPGTIEQTEWPLDGLEASFMYTVYDKDGNVLTERYFATTFS
jgi:vancomycin resistance protein YoaR